MKKTLVLFLVLSLAPMAIARTRSIGHRSGPWQTPRCATITGLDFIRYVEDNRVVGRRGVWEDPASFVTALAAGSSNVLYAVTLKGGIYQSNDAGCSWQERARVPEVLAQRFEVGIVAKGIAPVYVWTNSRLIRLTFGTVETLSMPENAVAVDTNPRDAYHLRAVSEFGRTFESFDGGDTWTKVGNPVFGSISDAAISPADFDHIVIAAYPGTLVSTDGGKTWTSERAKLQVARLAFTRADPNVVWADAWDPSANQAGAYRSSDGGRTFTLVRKLEPRRLYVADRLLPDPLDSTKIAFTQNGVHVIGTDGSQAFWFFDGIGASAWAPNGTLYFAADVPVSR